MAGARIDYVELPSATAHELTRAFYAKAFGWTFTDYGPDYAATTSGDVDLGLNGQPGEAWCRFADGRPFLIDFQLATMQNGIKAVVRITNGSEMPSTPM